MATPTTPLRMEPGTLFAQDFVLERMLGRGGMGEVWLVEQRSTGRRRALKTMSPSLVDNPRARERFAQEARVGARIGSEHVVEVIAAGIDEPTGTPWLAMELLEGEDLDALLTRRGALPREEAREVLEQLGDAIGRAHASGIIHRDLKPENVFIDRAPRRGVAFLVKVLDFGISTLVQEGRSAATVTSAIGSPLWMAPEQANRGAHITPATDVWAFGLIAFRALAGRSYWVNANGPAESFNLGALLVEVMTSDIAPASRRAAELGVPSELLPTGFDAWFARCVHRDPAQRFADGRTAVNALLPLLSAPAIPVAPTLPAVPRTQELAAHPLPPQPSGGVVPKTVAMEVVAPPVPGVAKTVAIPAMHGPSGEVVNPTEIARRTGPGAATGAAKEPPKGGGMFAAGLTAVTLLAAGVWWAMKSPPATAVTVTDAAVAAPTAVADASEAPAPQEPAPAPEPRCPEGMALVPGGLFRVGPGGPGDPRHAVQLSTFCIDRTEVSAGDYARCVESGSCTAARDLHYPNARSDEHVGMHRWCTARTPALANHPINCVSWPQSDAYCRWMGRRLPTEHEWEAAARGWEERPWPWGNEAPTAARANLYDLDGARAIRALSLSNPNRPLQHSDGFGATAPVDAFPDGASPYGVINLVGNVNEWVADWHGPYPATTSANAPQDPRGPTSGVHRVFRGGTFDGSVLSESSPTWRGWTEPATRSFGLGFRCAGAPQP